MALCEKGENAESSPKYEICLLWSTGFQGHACGRIYDLAHQLMLSGKERKAMRRVRKRVDQIVYVYKSLEEHIYFLGYFLEY